MLGQLPTGSLVEAEVPAYQMDPNIVGRSFPGLIWIADKEEDDQEGHLASSAALDDLLAHELAHQWIPGAGMAISGLRAEEIAEGVALSAVRAAMGAGEISLVRTRAREYFNLCREAQEVALREEPVRDNCSRRLPYTKGGLGLLALSDAMGPDHYFDALRRFVSFAELRAPGSRYPSIGHLTTELQKEGPPELDRLMNDLWSRRITYRNESLQATAKGDGVTFTAVAHRFDGGAGAERHELAEESSYLPVGGVDCDGKPVIVRWEHFENGKPTQVTLSASSCAGRESIPGTRCSMMGEITSPTWPALRVQRTEAYQRVSQSSGRGRSLREAKSAQGGAWEGTLGQRNVVGGGVSRPQAG